MSRRPHRPTPMPVLIGTAGWTVPRVVQASFPGADSHLARYARVFSCCEINSTFTRVHRPATFTRWAASVPPSFRFSVKLPKAITHVQRLAGAESSIDRFLAGLVSLADRLGCLLVQLPPSLELAPDTARAFLDALRGRFDGPVALEPRHASWFTDEADAMLRDCAVTRVAADPAIIPRAAEPGGFQDFVYYRWHGSPRVYYSSYGAQSLTALARRLAGHAQRGARCWCIFDNTTLGAATDNALALRRLLE